MIIMVVEIEEPISIQIQKYITGKGYVIGDTLGFCKEGAGITDSTFFGVIKRIRSSHPAGFLDIWIPEVIGYHMFNVKHVNKGSKIELDVYGRCFMDEVTNLAEDISKKFDVDIDLSLSEENKRLERIVPQD